MPNLIYYVKLKSHLSLYVCLSVCTFWHTDNSKVATSIEVEFAQNDSCVFEDYWIYF